MSNLDQYSRNLNESPGRGLGPVVSASVALGGVLALIGWLVLGFAMIFVWVFGSQSEAFALLSFRGPVLRAEGRVLSVAQTSMSEGGSKTSPGTPIFEITFEYDPATGAKQQDKCYTLGSQLNLGDTVQVEYVTGPPPRARVAGTRLAPFESWVLFVLIFPLAGLVLICTSYALGFKTLGMIRRGKLALGWLVDKTPTNTRINNRTVYKLTFEFVDEKGNAQHASIKTHHTEKVEDQAEERLFYDPRNPANARMIDLLPRGLKVGEDGAIHAGSGGFLMISAFAVPAFVIGVHVLVAWLVIR